MARHDRSFGRWEFAKVTPTGLAKRNSLHRLQHIGSLLVLDREDPILPKSMALAEDLSGFLGVNDQCSKPNDQKHGYSSEDDMVQRIRDEMASNNTSACPYVRSRSERLRRLLNMEFARYIP